MYLGIDLGTSELKALLLADDHRIIGTAAVALELQRPHPLWAEQNPADWREAMLAAVDRLAAEHPAELAAVRAIGLSGQMHGAVLLDARDEVLRPAILWNDGRAHAECAALEAAVPSARAITGNIAMPGFTAPKLLWARRHEPGTYAQTRLVLLPKDFLRFCLSGAKISDCSDASGTYWLDVGRRSWSGELLEACGLNESHMPGLAEGSAATGELRPELCRRWGMQSGVVIAGGAGDNAASAIGMGIVAAGQGFVSLGTSGVIFLASDGFRPNPPLGVHAFCHALPGSWHQMSVMLSAASCLAWVSRLTGREITELLAAVEQLAPLAQAGAPVFLPYLSGERTPHNDATAAGAFIGLTQAHGAADLAYAMLEGVAFGLKDGLLALDPELPSLAPLALVGGGARSPFWAQLLADALAVPLTLAQGSATAAALGAARLGWLAQGGAPDAVCRTAEASARFTPDAARGDALAPRYEKFRAAYPALHPSKG
ncbi:MAG: xylulokinase [Rhodospirillales bacterium 20-64-7]|nr:MAG: xylulokinase [Rhodospirillales bacterium 20-64-7]